MMTEEHDPALEEALRRLERETAGPLSTWSDARQAEVETAIHETGAADRSLSLEAFGELSGRRLHRRRGPWLAAATLAAGLLAGYFGRGLLERPSLPGQRTLLGPQGATEAYPGPLVDDYDRFEWSEPEGRWRYGLRVWNEGRLDAALSIDGLIEPRYTPTAVELTRLGKSIHWEVVLQDEDGRSHGTLLSASSSRSL